MTPVMIEATTKVRRHTDVAAHELGGSEGGVLLHLKSGQYHGVDHVGWTIWSLLDGSRSVAEVGDELRRRFPSAGGRIESDLMTFIRGLLDRNLIEVIAPGAET